MPSIHHRPSITHQSDPAPSTIAFPAPDENQLPESAACSSCLTQESLKKTTSPSEVSRGQQDDDKHSAPDPWERRKRWKKPAIKKRRFGVDIPLNTIGIRYFSDGSSSSDDDYFYGNKKSHSRTRAGQGKRAQRSNRDRRRASRYDPSFDKKQKKNWQRDHNKNKKRRSPAPHDESKKSTTQGVASFKVPSRNSEAKMKSKPKPSLKAKSFESRLEDLRAFKKEHGHCEVPYTYKANQPLSNWCSNVRYSYNVALKGTRIPTIKMTQTRIQTLKSIGFVFNVSADKTNNKKNKA